MTNVPERNKHRVFIPSVGSGRVEVLPGQKLIDLYRSHTVMSYTSSAEVAEKTNEAKRRIFRMDPNKKFQKR